MADFRWHGAWIIFATLIAHYRAQAHREPRSASFWRDRARAAIVERREQLAHPERLAA